MIDPHVLEQAENLVEHRFVIIEPDNSLPVIARQGVADQRFPTYEQVMPGGCTSLKDVLAHEDFTDAAGGGDVLILTSPDADTDDEPVRLIPAQIRELVGQLYQVWQLHGASYWKDKAGVFDTFEEAWAYALKKTPQRDGARVKHPSVSEKAIPASEFNRDADDDPDWAIVEEPDFR